MLFSANERAHWDFADQAGKAHVDWLHHCESADYEANVRVRHEQGFFELFSCPEPNVADIDAELRTEASRYLPAHLRGVIRREGSFRPIEAVEAAYGEMLGRARVTHIRSAIKELHEAGDVDHDGRGDFWDRAIRWTGGR